MRTVSEVLRSAALGAAFGATTSLINNVPAMLGEVGQTHDHDSVLTWLAIFFSLVLDSGWAWAVLAFALGWLAGTPSRLARGALLGPITGTIGLLTATVAYYATDLLFGIGSSGPTLAYWCVRAVVFGLPLGLAGVLARRPGPVGFLAGLTVPAGATVSMVLFPLRSGRPGESPAAVWAELCVWAVAAGGAALLTLRLIRHRRWPGFGATRSTDCDARPAGSAPASPHQTPEAGATGVGGQS